MSELINKNVRQDQERVLPPVTLSHRREKPCYTNGLTTEKTYLVVAVNEQFPDYNALGIRPLGGNEFKLHFWPNAMVFKLSKELFGLYRRDRSGRSNGSYDGCRMTREQVLELLVELRGNSECIVAPEAQVLEVLQHGFHPLKHTTA